MQKTAMDSTGAKYLRALQRKAAAEYQTIKFLRELYENPRVNLETKKIEGVYST